MRNVLIISPYFPPSTLAGVHRARHLAKYLPAVGWRPTVLCIDERFYTETSDVALAALLPPDLDIVKAEALPAGVARLLGIGDLSLRGFFHLKKSLRQILRMQPVDAIVITGAPYYSMLLSRWLKRRYRKPVVLDFQDPWVSAYGEAQPRFSKGAAAHWLAKRLEPLALRHADFVISVSDVQNEDMARRYPWFPVKAMAAIPIGGDPDDYVHLRKSNSGSRNEYLQPGFIHLSYVGTFLPRSGPVARALFSALSQLREETPELAARLRFNFIGTSNQPDDTGTYRFLPLAQAAGVSDLVCETPQRIPFLDALAVLAKSSIILLLGSDEPHYTASKIFPGLMSGRPFLSVFHSASSAHQILADAGGGRAFSFATAEELDGLRPRLARAIRELVMAPEAVGLPRREAVAPYAAPVIARRFADVLETITG
jgi:Glycosyl transferase 4-like domain